MKPHLALVALPLVLAALALGVKWRADHPTPTKEDLRIRALLAQPGGMEVSHATWDGKKLHEFKLKFSEKEFQAFVNCFYLSPQRYNSNPIAMSKNGIITIARDDRTATIVASLSLDKWIGELLISRPGKSKTRNIHPVTVKRWIELLIAHPRIGPELRARLK